MWKGKHWWRTSWGRKLSLCYNKQLNNPRIDQSSVVCPTFEAIYRRSVVHKFVIYVHTHSTSCSCVNLQRWERENEQLASKRKGHRPINTRRGEGHWRVFTSSSSGKNWITVHTPLRNSLPFCIWHLFLPCPWIQEPIFVLLRKTSAFAISSEYTNVTLARGSSTHNDNNFTFD